MDSGTAPVLFVTGVTGFLGRHFLYWQQREAFRFVVLVRGRNEPEARRRFLDSMRTACESYRTPFDEAAWSERTTVLTGDICEPACGLPDADVAWLRGQGVRQFWHFAASLNFEEKSQKKIWAQNVEGAAHVLDLARRAEIPEFIHCSTAYSVGKAAGMVEEVLHPLPRSFNNLYEESKCLAEHEVGRFCTAHGIRWAILRPSIVIGPRATKNSGGSTTGLYGFLKNLFKLEQTLKAIDHPITIIGDAGTNVNLIPVDDLMLDVHDLAKAPIASGTILHLTSNWYPDITKALRHTSTLMGIAPLQIAADTGGIRSPVEKVIDRRTQFHSSYLNNRLEFRRSLPRRYGVDNRDFAGFITEAYRESADEAPQSVFAVSVLDSFDGTPLKVFAAGSPARRAVVLSNAIGMPVEFWSGFAKVLAEDHFVLTWETRGCPNVDLPCDLAGHAFFDHVRDLMAILDRFGVERADVVGWCSGAQIALRTAEAFPDRVGRVVSVNGSFGGANGVAMTPFETKLREVMPKIARDRRVAEIYFNIVYGNRETGIDSEDLHQKNQEASAVLTSVDPTLLHLTSRPFENVEALFRYARLMTASLAEDVGAWIGNVTAPVLLYTGRRDQTAHPDCTAWLAGRLAGAALRIDEEGDHFTFYKANAVLDLVSGFIDAGTIKAEAIKTDRRQPAPVL